MTSKTKVKVLIATLALTLSSLVTPAQAENERELLGTIGGAVVGGLLGNQIGNGRGNTIATIAGAVIGGFVGNEIGRQMDENARRSMHYSYNDTVMHARHGQRRSWRSGRWNGDYDVVQVGYRPQTQVRCKTVRHTIYENGYQRSSRTRTSCYESTRWVPYEKHIQLVEYNGYDRYEDDRYEDDYRRPVRRTPRYKTISKKIVAPTNIRCLRQGIKRIENMQMQASRGHRINHRMFGSVEIIKSEVLFRCNRGRKSKALRKMANLRRQKGFTCSQTPKKQSINRGQRNVSQRLTQRMIGTAGGMRVIKDQGAEVIFRNGGLGRQAKANAKKYARYFKQAAYNLVYTCTKRVRTNGTYNNQW